MQLYLDSFGAYLGVKNNNGVLQLNTFYQLMTIFVVCVMTVFTIQKIIQGGRFPF